MRAVLFLAFFLVIHSVARAEWNLIRNVEWNDIDRLEVDNRGAIYVVKTNGDLSKFSSDGQLLLEYSPVINDRVQQMAINNQLRVYLFYQGFQSMVVLDRYLTSPRQYSFVDYGFGFVSNVTPNLQQNLWIVDMSDFSLKLFDLSRNYLLETKSLSKVLNRERIDITDLVSHQNHTYLFDKHKGVLVFDNLGNYLRTLKIAYGEYYGFDRDEMYYVQSDNIIFTNLYTNKTRVVKLPDGAGGEIRFHDNMLYVIHQKGFSIYKYLSAKN